MANQQEICKYLKADGNVKKCGKFLDSKISNFETFLPLENNSSIPGDQCVKMNNKTANLHFIYGHGDKNRQFS